ncbi:MAG TPA: YciI family protein [Solirubrobacterales bacterium]|nr:YciI family protein [Solirubrobacterales bacterium]
MKYVLAIYDDESRFPALSQAEQEAEIEAYWRLDADAIEAGVFIASEPLQPTPETTTVVVRDEDAVVTDGPFAETKEQLGGFYLLDCESREDAVAWAARIPAARHGRVEVRPVMEFEPPEWFREETKAGSA